MKHAKRTILIVDDDPSSITVLVKILSPDYRRDRGRDSGGSEKVCPGGNE